MNEVSGQFAIEEEKKEHWKSTYEHDVRDALKNRRNNTAQDLKKELNGKWDWRGEQTTTNMTNNMCINSSKHRPTSGIPRVL